MLKFLAVGEWKRGAVRLQWSDPSSRRIVPEVEAMIETAWAAALAVPGVHLFDGPMCRMESLSVSPAELSMCIAPTSYKTFVGTNLHNARLAAKYGPGVMANAIGVSALVETGDGHLLLGRRNASVAYYPSRIHPFAGALEPNDHADAFETAYRELEEELGLLAEQIVEMTCLGLVEDLSLLQPEFVFIARTERSLDSLVKDIDPTEHLGSWSTAAAPADIENGLPNPLFTPVAAAAQILWGRTKWGDEWFDRCVRSVGFQA